MLSSSPRPLLSCSQKFLKVAWGTITLRDMIIFGIGKQRKQLLVKSLGPRTSLLGDPLGIVI